MASGCGCPSSQPPVSGEYIPRGKRIDIGGSKTYVTSKNPEKVKKAVIVVYDIFGFYPQILRGVDGLVEAKKGEGMREEEGEGEEYVFFIPDFFEGNAADVEWYPPDTPEKLQKLGEWYQARTPQLAVDRVPGIIADIERVYGEKTWGIQGYCWGGKATSILTSSSSQFKISIQCHPALIDAAEAKAITIPTLVLASEEEPRELVEKYIENLACDSEKKEAHFFEDMKHGWLSARGDLDDEYVLGEWRRGYALIGEFLGRWF